MFPTPVPQKGLDASEYATRNVIEALEWLGHSGVILRTDGEAAIQNVAGRVAEHRSPNTRTAPETTPVGDSRSNGFGAQSRTLLRARSEKVGCRIGGDWDLLLWIILHSGTLINRFHSAPGNDGKTPCERATGGTSKREMLGYRDEGPIHPR